MKKRTKRTIKETKAIVVLFIATIVFAVSCGKDGAPGQDGTDGQPGSAGTANVVASNWFPGKAWDEIVGTTYKAGAYTVPQTVMDEVGGGNILSFVQGGGTFLLYMKLKISATSTSHQIYPVPVSFNNTNCAWTVLTPDYGYTADQFLLMVFTGDGSATESIFNNPPTNLEFRYVLIPAGRQMQVAKGLGRDVIDSKALQGMGYTEAKELLGWED